MLPNRLTLLAGIFAIGSYFLCVLSGVVGWFHVYFSYTTLVTALCFFALVTYSFGAQFLLQTKKQSRLTKGSFRKTKLLAIFSIPILISAHIFILKYNVSPSENLLGNHDQGMYLAAASNLKTSGSHKMITNWICQSPAKYKRFLTKAISPSLKTESSDAATNTGTQAGFYLMDADGCSQYIQFPPGYPTVLAIFWSLGGYPLVLHSNLIICLICGLMLAAVCLNFTGSLGALATWLLFLFCPLTIWSANHLYAEPALLLLWLTALWALGHSDEHPLLSATLVALSIGAAFLIKIDALPLFVLPLSCALICKGQRLRYGAILLILSVVVAILSTGFYVYYSKPYFEFTLSGLFSGRLLLLAVCTLGFVAVVLTVRKVRLKAFAILQKNSRQIAYGLAVAIGLALLYFYFVRPYTAEPHQIFAGKSGAKMDSLREQTFYRLGWYFTPLGLTLACAGLIAAFTQRTRPAQLAFTGIALLFLLYYSYDLHCTPYQPYAMRRLFPFVVPALCFGIPFLVRSIPVKLCSPELNGLLVLVVSAVFLPQFQQITQKLIIRENYKGLYRYLETVSQKLPKDELILVNGKGQAYLHAAALRYIFGKNCILIYPDYRARDYHEMIPYFIEDDEQAIHVLSTFPNDRMNLRAEILSTQKLSDTLHTTYSGTETTDYPDEDTKPFKLSLYLTKLSIP